MAALNGQRTFLQLQNAVGAVLFEQTAPSADTYPTLASIKDKINEVYRRVYVKQPWLWGYAETTINTTANNKLLTMPDGVQKIWGLQLQSINQPIRYVPRNKLLLSYPGGWNQVNDSYPIFWTDAEQASNNAMQINLFPAPDAVYTITYQYQVRLTPLSADGDYSVIQPEYEDVLIYGTLADLLRQLSDQRADYYEAKYAEIQRAMWMDAEKKFDYMDAQMQYGGNMVAGWPGLVQPYLQ
jgi:hypothetical protein